MSVVVEQEFLSRHGVGGAVDRVGVVRVDEHVVGLVEHVDGLESAAGDDVGQFALTGQVVVADDRDVA